MRSFIYRLRAAFYMWCYIRAQCWALKDCWNYCESFVEKDSYMDEGVPPHNAVLEDMTYWTD